MSMSNRNNNLHKLKKKERKAMSDDKIAYYRKWRKEHPNYFIKYYKENSKTIIENAKRYIESDKGKATVLRYEQSEKRMKAKREWQRMKRLRG